jgi:tetratricopeptide (TPR) repeat protein
MMQGEYARALPLMKKKIELQPDIFDAYYNIACIYSLQNEIDDAVIWLEKAVEKGFKDWKILETDRDLDNIRGSSYYKKLMKHRSD